MRKLLLFLSLGTLFTANAQTSVYHQFPDSIATWNFKFEIPCWAVGGMSDVDYSLSITGDTTISSQVYHKLHTPFVQINSTGNCTVPVPVGYRGGLREDTLARKVYYMAPSQTVEQLLYDFNLQVGDTVTGVLRALNGPPDQVTVIDSVLVGSSYRKRWHINPLYNMFIIEGLGSTYGLFEASPGYVTDYPSYTLLCFSQDNQVQYPGFAVSCMLINGTTDPELSQVSVSVYPNPAAGAFTVDLQKAGMIKTARLYDVNGKLLREQLLNGQHLLHFDALENGLYLLVLSDASGNRITQRISSSR